MSLKYKDKDGNWKQVPIPSEIDDNSVSDKKTYSSQKIINDRLSIIKNNFDDSTDIVEAIGNKTLEELGIAPFRLLDLSGTSESNPLIIAGDIVPSTYITTTVGYVRAYENTEIIYMCTGSIIVYNDGNNAGVTIINSFGSWYYDYTGTGGYCITNNEIEALIAGYEDKFAIKAQSNRFIINVPYQAKNKLWTKINGLSETIKITFRDFSDIDEAMFRYRISLTTSNTTEPTLTITNNSSYNVIHIGTDCENGIWAPKLNMKYIVDYILNDTNIIGTVTGYSTDINGIPSVTVTEEAG